MNQYQELWWKQSQSDYAAFLLLRNSKYPACHQLHYLQMVTEKLAKAYFWRTGTPPPRVHSGFTQFMRSLGGVPSNRQAHIASTLDFKSFAALQTWMRMILPLMYDLEHLAPSLANNGPNPEYPWPHIAPAENPVGHTFAIWGRLNTGQGRQLISVIGFAVDRFPSYG